jgi:hypothetical protein
MNKYIITFLSFYIIITIILNFRLNESFSQTYIKIDGKIIPLLIPPYKMIKWSNNSSSSQLINITYVPNTHETQK